MFTRKTGFIYFYLFFFKKIRFHSAFSSHTPHHTSPEDEAAEGVGLPAYDMYLLLDTSLHVYTACLTPGGADFRVVTASSGGRHTE